MVCAIDTDHDLIKKCLSGETEAYRLIMEKYSGKALALAINVLRNHEDAQDACQDAFVKAYLNLKSFDFRKNFKNWFYTLLYNRCIDIIRRRRRSNIFLGKWKHEHPSVSLPIEGRREIGLDKWDPQLMQDLSPKERMALFLWAHDGYTSEEIASILRCSASTARVHLFKARKKIKAFLEKTHVAMQDS